MIARLILIFVLLICALPVRAENIDDPYRNASGVSWWQSQLNNSPWLREKTGGEFKFNRSMAIVIGIGDYESQSGWGTLASPINDAKAMRTFLQSSGFDEVYTMTNASATRERLDQLIGHAEATLGPDDRFFFYWSGHGGRGDNGDGTEFGFLPFANTSTTGVGRTVSMSEFRIWAQRIKARHTLFVLDSCFSGNALPASRTNRSLTRERLSKRADYVFTSSSNGQESYGYKDGSGGLFTRAFLGAVGALNGQLAADYDLDGFVTLAEIQVAVKRKLDDASGSYPFIMSPQVSAIGATMGEFFFIAPSGPPAPIQEPDLTPRPVQGAGLAPPSNNCARASRALDDFNKRPSCDSARAFTRRFGAQDCYAVDIMRGEEERLCANPTTESREIATYHAPPPVAPFGIAASAWLGDALGSDLSSFRELAGAPEMVVIPAGNFMMGSPKSESGRYSDEGPQRNVKVGQFALGRTEVTFDEWQACVDGGGCQSNPSPSDAGWGRDSRPVINVSWNDAQEYVSWLNGKISAEVYRLPSESEWEYSARAGTTTAFPWGLTASHDHANYGTDECCGGLASGRDQWVNTAPVGSFPANRFGLADTHGNVWEWADDCWHGNYTGAPLSSVSWQSASSGACSQRVLRGGSWGNVPRNLRSALRDWLAPDDRNDFIGFRLARTLTP